MLTEDIEMEGEDDADADTSSMKQRTLAADMFTILLPLLTWLCFCLRLFVGLSLCQQVSQKVIVNYDNISEVPKNF